MGARVGAEWQYKVAEARKTRAWSSNKGAEMKTIKAWAVVDSEGNLLAHDQAAFRTRQLARNYCVKEFGERVVRVTITVEEE